MLLTRTTTAAEGDRRIKFFRMVVYSDNLREGEKPRDGALCRELSGEFPALDSMIHSIRLWLAAFATGVVTSTLPSPKR